MSINWEADMVAIRLTEQPSRNISRSPNKLIEQMGKGYYSFFAGETWTPNVNLYETESAYLVCVDLAGVDKDKIDIHVADGRLTLRGSRPVPAHADSAKEAYKAKVHLMEIDHGGFARDVELPHDVIRDHITANYENGMLWIELPKAQ
jgi:HSP20 family protein